MGKSFKTTSEDIISIPAAIRRNRRLIDRYHAREIKRSGNPFLVHPTDDFYPTHEGLYEMFGPQNVKVRQLTPAELWSERIEQMAKKYAGK